MSLYNGERLTPEQNQRRSRLINALLNYYLNHRCCRRRPDWAQKIHRMELQKLEERYVDVFKRALE